MENSTTSTYAFLPGEGEMAALIRRFDWATTPLGTPNQWPTSLRTLINMMLTARFPMLIFWGPELITFYNDAFRPSLGVDGKHPSSLGQPGEQSWSESWPVIGPMIQSIMAGGEAVWFEDQKLALYRNGQMGYAYWTYSFSPLSDDMGAVNGILVTCTETTKAVERLQQLNQANAELTQSLIQNTVLHQTQREKDAKFKKVANTSPTGLWLSDPTGGLTYLNETLVAWTGMAYHDLLGIGWVNAIVETDRQRAAEVFSDAVANRSHYEVTFRIKKNDRTVIWCRAAGDPFYEEDGRYGGYAGFCLDIQAAMDAQQQLLLSEQRFQNLVRQATVGIIVLIGEDMRVRIVNDGYGKLIDRTYEELIDKPLFAVIPEAEAYFGPLIDQVRNSGESHYLYDTPYAVQANGILKEGYLNIVYQPYRETDGTITGVAVLCQDVTEQVVARQKLGEAETGLRGAVELAQLGTWSIDVATNGLTFSDRLIEWFGYDPGAQAYHEVIPILEAGDQQRVDRAVAWALHPESGGVYNEIYTVIHPRTGQKRVLHAQGKTVFDATGKAVRLNGTAQDITLQRNLQLALESEVQQRTEELAATNEELASSNEEYAAINEEYAAINEELEEAIRLLNRSNENLQEFTYVASHDLQEPLRKIQQFGDLLRNQYGAQVGEGLPYLERMQAAANRMSTLIQDLLSYSRLGMEPSAFGAVSLSRVMDTVLTDLELRVEESGAKIEVDALPTVQGDASQLSQLFQNLVSNALKFRQPAPVIPHIRVKSKSIEVVDLPNTVNPSRAAAAYYQIDIIDNGIGFDSQYVDRIFQVFQRLHGKNQFDGTGIGLAICQKVAVNHGGAITASSVPGQGATFSVYLPL